MRAFGRVADDKTNQPAFRALLNSQKQERTPTNLTDKFLRFSLFPNQDYSSELATMI